MEKAVRILHSFEEAEESDRNYYQSLTPLERLQILLELNHHWREGTDANLSTKHERVYRVIKR